MKFSLSLVLALLTLSSVALVGCRQEGDVPGEAHPMGYGTVSKMTRPEPGGGAAMASKMGYKMPTGEKRSAAGGPSGYGGGQSGYGRPSGYGGR